LIAVLGIKSDPRSQGRFFDQLSAFSVLQTDAGTVSVFSFALFVRHEKAIMIIRMSDKAETQDLNFM
jgi:hypothetical protein